MSVKLIFLAGSARKNSVNIKLAKAAAGLADMQGATATFIDLADYDMPIFNEDWEAENGLPQAAKDLRALFAAHDGFFVASPEYNSSFSALLKNTFDWMTRTGSADEDGLIAFRGKVAALSAASPGGLGGMRGLVPLRMWLGNIGVHIIPSQLAVPHAFKVFGDDGTIQDDGQKQALQDVVDQLIQTTKAMTVSD